MPENDDLDYNDDTEQESEVLDEGSSEETDDPAETEAEPEEPSLPEDPEEAKRVYLETIAEQKKLAAQVANLDRARARMWSENKRLRQRSDTIVAMLERAMAGEVDKDKSKVPSPDEDIVGHLKGSIQEMLDERLKPLEERLGDQQVTAEQAATDSYLTSSRAEFDQSDPGYPIDDAVQHVLNVNFQSIQAELALRHPQADPYDIEQEALRRVEQQRDLVVYRMRQAGRNVFKEVRKAAEARGFRPASNGSKPNRMEQMRQDVRSESPGIAGKRVPPPSDPSKIVTSRKLSSMKDDEFGDYLAQAAEKLGLSEDEVFRRAARRLAR